MLLNITLFILGFIFLIKGADFLVDGSSALAKKWKISSLVIGLTIVSIGTSMPELVVNIMAGMKNVPEIAIGNVLGSNIVNILLILGLASIIFPLKLTKGTVWKELPFSVLAVVIVWFLSNDYLIEGSVFSGLSRSDGFVLMLFFVFFLFYIFHLSRRTSKDSCCQNSVSPVVFSSRKAFFYIFIGLVGLVAGAHWVVNGASVIAVAFGASTSFISLTIVSIGTSLPEIATSLIAAFKKESDIAVGNIVGSNIFNLLWVLGLSAVIRPLSFSPIVNSDMLMVIVASLFLFLFMFIGRKHILQRWQGFLFIIIYIIYIAYLVLRG
ncbi:MAG: calcium/sodium antiporter [Patescibacteria group bacterium]